jgi:hypothetical protein
MIEPMRVWEEEAGRPSHQVLRFRMMAAIRSANTWQAGAGAHLQDEFHRQQRDDAERDGAAGEQHAEEIERAGIHHRDVRLQ